MAEWIRSFNGDFVGSANADLNGLQDLDNDTIPGDFDPAGVTSVQFEFTLSHLGTFGTGSSADSHALQSVRIATTGGTTLAQVAATGTITDGTATVVIDLTDSSPNTGANSTEWSGARFIDVGAGTVTVFNQGMGPDGVTPQILASSVTITIDYTPVAVAVVEQHSYRWEHDYDGDEAGSTFTTDLNTQSVWLRKAPTRLRVLLKGTVDDLAATTDWKLMVDTNGGGYVEVTGATDVQIVVSTAVADAAATTQRIGSGTFGAGKVREHVSSSVISNVGITSGEETELVWVVKTDTLTLDDVLSFRVQYDSGGGFVDADTLTQTPSLLMKTVLTREQVSFRWRDDDDTEADATWLELKNVDHNDHDGATGNKIRLRIAITTTIAGGATTDWDFQWAKNGGGFAQDGSTWTQTTSVHFAAGDPTTEQLESGDFHPGTIEEGSVQILQTEYAPLSGTTKTELEIIIVPNVQLTPGDFYDFRFIGGSGGPFGTYTETPRLTIAGGAVTVYPPFPRRQLTTVRM